MAAARTRSAKARLRPVERTLIIAGMLLIAAAVYANVRADMTTQRSQALSEALHGINQHVTYAHVGLLDDLAGRRTVFARDRGEHVREALQQCQRLVAGSTVRDDTLFGPQLEVTGTRFGVLCDNIAILSDLALARIAGDDTVVAAYDETLERFLVESAALPVLLREEARLNQTSLVRLLGARIVFIVVVFAGTVLVLRRRVRDQEQLESVHERILDTTSEGIVGISRTHEIRFVNPAGVRLLGTEAADLVGRSAHAALCGRDEVDRDDHPDCLAVTAINETRQATFSRADGTLIPVELSVSELDDANIDLAGVVAFRDITERNRIEQLRSQFVSMVSHELRTPLTAIHGALGLLRGGQAGELTQRAHRMAEIAHTSTERLVRLINDILDLERLDSTPAPLNVDEVRLDLLVERAVDALDGLGDAHIRSDVPPLTVRIDPDRVEQLVVNLLGNAAKFSPPNMPVVVSAAVTEAGEVDLVVTDNGRGIPEQDLERIFSRFEQVDGSDSRELGGTGLGLAICKSVAEQHGGEIWAESVVGSGSTFTFRIPAFRVLETPSSVARKPDDSSRAGGTAPRVMLSVTDQQAFALAEQVLEGAGFLVQRPDSTATLVDAVVQSQPDAVVVHARGIDGADCAAVGQLRTMSATRDIPLVLLTFGAAAGEDVSTEPEDERVNLAELVRSLVNELRLPRQPRLLLIEDDLELVNVLAAMLESAAVEVVHVADGDAAVAWCSANVPDLISLDLALPGRDGFSVVEWLRQHKQLRQVPLVVYTARDLTDTDREALRLGDTRFLTKSRIPVDEFHRVVLELVTRLTGGASDEPPGAVDR